MKKSLIVFLAVLALLTALFLTSCGKKEDKDTRPSEAEQKTDFRLTVDDFSYENDKETIINFYSPDTKTEGFKNTTATEFHSVDEVYAHAEKELLLKEYDLKFISYDSNEKIWKVTYRKNKANGTIESIMDIYFSDDGITLITVLDK